MPKMICFVVVLYGCEISDSSTLNSLKEHISNLDNQHITLYIRNNGPQTVFFDEHYFSGFQRVFFTENINNVALSKIYNDAIAIDAFDYVVILDQDSILECEFFLSLKKAIKDNVDLLLPKIIAKNIIRYPKLNRKIIEHGEYTSKEKLSSISSGLVISNRLIEVYENHFSDIFDERFVFYGVDSSFFLRLRKIKENVRVRCDGYIYHSLSSIDEDINKKNCNFRLVEGLYDLSLQMRFYPRVSVLFYFLRKLFYNIFSVKNHDKAIIMLSVFFRGKHPRS